jgi:putative ABC transport system permease protein
MTAMLRNWIAAAIGNLARNWLYAGLTIIGLALAFSAAILIGLFVRQELSYDRFIPDYAHVYRLQQWYRLNGRAPAESERTTLGWASEVKAAYPGITAATRIIQDYPIIRSKRNDPGVRDPGFAWVDADFFRVFPLRAIAGDPATALRQPGNVVLTRSAARRYFGRDVPLGAVLDVTLVRRALLSEVMKEQPGDRRPLRVTAVIEDLPATTHLIADVFASAAGIYSTEGRIEPGGLNRMQSTFSYVWTYFRLAPDASPAALGRALAKVIAPMQASMPGKDDLIELRALPIADIHLGPPSQTPDAKPTSDPQVLLAIGIVGLLILLIAGTNFVTLMTARSSRRAVEVAVRKAAGASRENLIVQFLGEALIYVLLALILGMALAELLLPTVNAMLGRSLEFHYFADPALAATIIATALIVGILAGLYPAFILSAPSPAVVLKGGMAAGGTGSALVRQGLVLLQFAILLVLIVATVTVYRQTDYALSRALRAGGDPIVTVYTNCNTGFPQAVRELPGVRAASCGSLAAMNVEPKGLGAIPDARGQIVPTSISPIEFGYFDVFGIRPIAGRVFSPDHPGDAVLGNWVAPHVPVVINATAAARFGFATPAAAVGQSLRVPAYVLEGVPTSAEVIGVVPDQPHDVRQVADPEFYVIGTKQGGMLAARTTPAELRSTIAAIRRLWPQLGEAGPIRDGLMSQLQRTRYQDIITQGAMLAAGAGLALFIACLGLFSLSAFTAEQRIKEIGVRKAMGASTFAIVRLLLWQFTKPLLLANLIAWPLAWWALNRWLQGFAYRVDLPLWLFMAATGATLVAAWATVSAQTLLVARARPVDALRYE